MDSLKNIFAIPELRKRVLSSACSRSTGLRLHSHARGQHPGAAGDCAGSQRFVRPLRHVRTEPSQMTMCAGRDAASVHHPAAPDGRSRTERLSKEGARPPEDYAYAGHDLSLVQSLGIVSPESDTNIAGGYPPCDPGWGLAMMLTLTTGSVLVMWLSRSLSAASAPHVAPDLRRIVVGCARLSADHASFETGEMDSSARSPCWRSWWSSSARSCSERGHRRVTVGMPGAWSAGGYGGASTHIPLKVNTRRHPAFLRRRSWRSRSRRGRCSRPTAFRPRGAAADPGLPAYNLLHRAHRVLYFYTAIISTR